MADVGPACDSCPRPSICSLGKPWSQTASGTTSRADLSMVMGLLSCQTQGSRVFRKVSFSVSGVAYQGQENVFACLGLRIIGFGRKEVLASMVTTAAETAKVISSLHRSCWQRKDFDARNGSACWSAVLFVRRFGVVPFLDLTNTSHCSRTVSFYPCQLRARFDIC